MHFLFYKITNNINNKIYYGVHRTININDGYMGSGTLLKRAQLKYGLENFTKEIIKDCSTCEEMFEMESILVNEDFIKQKDNYNLKVGGVTGLVDFTKTEYYKSGAHIKNAKDARVKAATKIQKNKKLRRIKYKNNPKLCKRCEKPILYEKKINNFCSQSCSASFNNTGRIASDEQKQKTSKSLKGKKKNKRV